MGKQGRKDERKGRNGEWTNGAVGKQAAPDIKIYQSVIANAPSSISDFRRPDRTSFKGVISLHLLMRLRYFAIELSFWSP